MPDLTCVAGTPAEITAAAKRLFREGQVEALQAAGFVVGWRVWETYELQPVLVSWLFCDVWPSSAPLVADRKRRKKWNLEGGKVLPGVHIVTKEPHELRSASTCCAGVIGFCAGWGETTHYTRGAMAQYATPVALIHHDGEVCVIGRDHLVKAIVFSKKEQIEQIISEYKVQSVTIPEFLTLGRSLT